MLKFDGSHVGRIVEMLQNENGVEWSLVSLCIHYAFHAGRHDISPAQTIKLGKIASFSTAIV